MFVIFFVFSKFAGIQKKKTKKKTKKIFDVKFKSPSVDDFVIVMMMVMIPVCRSGSERSPVVGVVPLGRPATEIGETEDSELVPEERTHGHVDEEFEKRVANAQPEYGEM